MKCLLVTAIFCLIATVSTNDSNVRGSMEEPHRLKRQTFTQSSSSSSSSSTSSGGGPTQFQQSSSSFQSHGPIGNGNLESRFGEDGGSSVPAISTGHVSFTSGTYDPNTQQTYIHQNIHQTIPNQMPIQNPYFPFHNVANLNFGQENQNIKSKQN